MSKWHYVCDACGLLATHDEQLPEDTDYTCEGCGGGVLWEFTDKRKALQHSRHIEDGVRSGLFRKVSR